MNKSECEGFETYRNGIKSILHNGLSNCLQNLPAPISLTRLVSIFSRVLLGSVG